MICVVFSVRIQMAFVQVILTMINHVQTLSLKCSSEYGKIIPIDWVEIFIIYQISNSLMATNRKLPILAIDTVNEKEEKIKLIRFILTACFLPAKAGSSHFA